MSRLIVPMVFVGLLIVSIGSFPLSVNASESGPECPPCYIDLGGDIEAQMSKCFKGCGSSSSEPSQSPSSSTESSSQESPRKKSKSVDYATIDLVRRVDLLTKKASQMGLDRIEFFQLMQGLDRLISRLRNDPRGEYYKKMQKRILSQVNVPSRTTAQQSTPKLTPTPSLTGTSASPSKHLSFKPGVSKTLDPKVLAALNKAADEFYKENNVAIQINSAGRTLADQANEYFNACAAGKCENACNPAKGYSTTLAFTPANKAAIVQELVSNGNKASCPHTTNVAVDAWCAGGSSWQYDPLCQQKLTKKMIDSGFCRLKGEGWHFEWNANKRSATNCVTTADATYTNRKGTFDPTKDLTTGKTCLLWNYDTDSCVKTAK